MPVAPLQRGGNRASSNSTFGNNQPSSSINSNYTHHHQHSHSTNIKDDNRSAPHLGPMLHHGRGSAPPPAFKGGCNSGTNSPPRDTCTPAGPTPAFPPAPTFASFDDSLPRGPLPPLSVSLTPSTPSLHLPEQHSPRSGHSSGGSGPCHASPTHYLPNRRVPTAFMRKHPLRQGPGGAGQSSKPAGVRAPAPEQPTVTYTDLPPVPPPCSASPGAGAESAFWVSSSVSGLEAMDSILDDLVVLNAKMRAALIHGPLVSFETMVPRLPRPAVRPLSSSEADVPEMVDSTFHLTSVAVEEATVAEEEARESSSPEDFSDTLTGSEKSPDSSSQSRDTMRTPSSSPIPAADEVPARPGSATPPTPEGSPNLQGKVGSVTHGISACAAAPAKEVPVASLLPKVTWAGQVAELDPTAVSSFKAALPLLIPASMTRMYIVSKLTTLPKCPPPPPPTAEHLLKTRPPSFIAAPSYDQLCVQIRDVQRQYTCGTGHDRPSSGRAAPLAAVAAQRQQTHLNSYISGLDGPSLEGVVNTTDLPIALERGRPSFVAMRRQSSLKGLPQNRSRPPRRSSTSNGTSLSSTEPRPHVRLEGVHRDGVSSD
ncbi:MAG: hypothetical protein WDW38_002241 [Sanguina aurantia]